MTNTSGVVVERLAYDPWGKRRFINGTADTLDAITSANIDRGFTMHEHIDEMGIINMNGRIYDPLIGRFMSADPYIQAPSDLQSFNRYAYVRNNPLNKTDPSGYSWWTKLRDKFIKPFIAKLIDPLCGGCATVGLAAWNGYWTRGADGKYLRLKGAAYYAGLSLIPGSDNVVLQAGINALGACGGSLMAGGSCRDGMLNSLGNSAGTMLLGNNLLGASLGGCLGARAIGNGCAAGAREAFTSMAGNNLAQMGADTAHGYLNNRNNSGGGSGITGGSDTDIDTLIDEHIRQLEVSNTVQLACYPCEGGGWGISDTLEDHYKRHGSKFGAKSESDYVSQSQRFYRDGLLNPNTELRMHNNTIYLYDKVTNTFGAYNMDGTTKTYMKPREGHWENLNINGNLGKPSTNYKFPKLTPNGQTLRLLRLFGNMQE